MDIKEYFRMLDEKVEEQYRIAGEARKKGIDPSNVVEAVPTRNLAERVEGLVGPKYIADEIKKAQEEKLSREKIVERVIDWILKGTYLKDTTKEERIEQALRTALAILTEGVVSAPLEGISKVVVEKNPDGSNYLAIYFAGPIRGAGGTAAALSVLLGDYIRKKEGIQNYRPTETEVERYKEEIHIYHKRIVRLQYYPSDQEIETIVKSVPVCIDGDPTEKIEVDLHRGLERVKTDRIRGGICLVIGEGIAQKYKKVLKFAEEIGLEGWGWLADLKKSKDQKGEETREEKPEAGFAGLGAGAKPLAKSIRPNKKFLEDLVVGRPIFAYPSRPGGFRLRYGRSNMCGIASKAIHPATMEILDEFPVLGTQLRIERPGKGMVAVPCAEMEGPVIKDRDDNVIAVNSLEQARKIKPKVVEILSLGDMMISFGDFLNSNEILPPSGYVEEWWEQEYEKAAGKKFEGEITGQKAVELALEHKIPLHPRYTYPWHDIKAEELKLLGDWVKTGRFDGALKLKFENEKAKRVLEVLSIPHTVVDEGITVQLDDNAVALLASLGLFKEGKIDAGKWDAAGFEEGEDSLEKINELSDIVIKRKVGCYIGARMGRPEKARERLMTPAPHVLFPVGEAGGRTRSVNVARKNIMVQTEIVRRRCPKCKKVTFLGMCSECNTPTEVEYRCSCGSIGKDKICERCKIERTAHEEREVPIKAALEKASSRIGVRPQKEIKGVKGMTSALKMPEPLEKGILRSLHDVFVFKDGTIRYDGTDVPTTHFMPKEIGTPIERLKELGYDKDIEGKPLERDDQIVEMLVQDIIIPKDGLEYLINVCKFIDDLLVKVYGQKRFYKVKTSKDLIGQVVVGLAPHTSAAIVGRIIGIADVRAILAHPFWHAAKRRNCDGDEDSIMFLMDILLNFSHGYLPETRGGRMDAPLVVNTNLDPKEVDSEAHCMETVNRYPLEFYELTQTLPYAKEVKMPIVEDNLEGDPYHMGLTHFSSLAGVPKTSQYVQLGDMKEKADVELKLCTRIRAVDVGDTAKRLVDSHLIRDTYGNLRAFARQKFRCVKCNKKYRRVPLIGRCEKCGGRVILTVSRGTIEKYVDLTTNVVNKYVESDYVKQRMELVKSEIKSVFENDKVKQYALSDFA